MLIRSLMSFSMVFLLGSGTLAWAENELCSSATEQEFCTILAFEVGLPSEGYSSTILSISKFIEDDFKLYLTDSHGPFSEGKTPTIDYEVNLLSASYVSEAYGLTKFVVLSTPTSLKPFGIIAIKSSGALQEIPVSYGYSPYAILERKNKMYLLYKDRFSESVMSVFIQ